MVGCALRGQAAIVGERATSRGSQLSGVLADVAHRSGRVWDGANADSCVLGFPLCGRRPRHRCRLTATFIGHAAVHMTDGSTAALFDVPYEAGTRFMHWSAESVPREPASPFCLVTHGHREHFATELAPSAESCSA